MILAERWNGTRWRVQPTPLLPAARDMAMPAVACPARTACTAVGGFENDGPGSVSLAEQWRGSGTSAAQTAPGVFSSRAYSGIAGCLRAVHVWVANQFGNSVPELNATTGVLVKIITRSSYGFDQPSAVSSDGTNVWVPNYGDQSVTGFPPRAGEGRKDGQTPG
jgi:hypothetical protein